jgi:hypothetical protein
MISGLCYKNIMIVNDTSLSEGMLQVVASPLTIILMALEVSWRAFSVQLSLTMIVIYDCHVFAIKIWQSQMTIILGDACTINAL